MMFLLGFAVGFVLAATIAFVFFLYVVKDL